MKSIYIVGVVIPKEFEEAREVRLEELRAVASPGTQLHVVYPDEGPVFVESRYDETLAAPYILKKIQEVADKADAIIINCFGEPGIEAAREITEVPVIGPGTSAMALAQLLGDNFSIISPNLEMAPLLKKIAAKLGTTKLVSVRGMEIMSLFGLEDKAKTLERLIEESIKAIEDDGAHVIVLGCTGMTGLGEQARQELVKRNYNVPVLDPMIVALNIAEDLVNLKLSQSKVLYGQPLQKVRTGVIETK